MGAKLFGAFERSDRRDRCEPVVSRLEVILEYRRLVKVQELEWLAFADEATASVTKSVGRLGCTVCIRRYAAAAAAGQGGGTPSS